MNRALLSAPMTALLWYKRIRSEMTVACSFDGIAKSGEEKRQLKKLWRNGSEISIMIFSRPTDLFFDPSFRDFMGRIHDKSNKIHGSEE